MTFLLFDRKTVDKPHSNEMHHMCCKGPSGSRSKHVEDPVWAFENLKAWKSSSKLAWSSKLRDLHECSSERSRVLCQAMSTNCVIGYRTQVKCSQWLGNALNILSYGFLHGREEQRKEKKSQQYEQADKMLPLTLFMCKFKCCALELFFIFSTLQSTLLIKCRVQQITQIKEKNN